MSCEQPVEEEAIPYQPKLVIRGFITEGVSVKDIYIGRTLPVSVKYSSSFANLSDAAAVIINRDLVYPLKHYGNGLYKNDTLRIVSGEKYYFIANWQNLSASAVTMLPTIGRVSNLEMKTEVSVTKKTSYMQANISPFNDEVYGATWVVLLSNGSTYFEADSFANIASKPLNGLMNVRTSIIPQNYISDNPPLAMRLHIYDHAYADYYNTQGSNKVADAIFGQTGSKIKWNVSGDGIGMFIAKRDTLVRLR